MPPHTATSLLPRLRQLRQSTLSRLLRTALVHPLRDARDLPVATLIAKMLLVFVPLVALLFVRFSWLLAPLYIALIFRYSAPFAGLIHEATHRRLFVPRYSALGTLIVEWIICPIFGMSPHLYAAQHVGMHHPENNLDGDASATIGYHRDSVIEYARYAMRFVFMAHWEVFAYLRRNRKRRLLRRAVVGLAAQYAMVAAALAYDWRAALVVMIIPMVFIRVALSAGNWAQHGFVDPHAPQSPYLNTITCLHPAFNRATFNSGYHSAHHAKPSLHWSELPSAFDANLDRYHTERAIVFVGIEFGHVFLAMMFGRYRWLAAHQLSCGEDLSLLEARLRYRLRPTSSLDPMLV